MQVFLIITYFVTIFIFVAPFSLGVRLVFDSKAEKPVILVRMFNRSRALPKKATKDKKDNKKSNFKLKFSYEKLPKNYIIIDNFKIEITTPKELAPIINYPLSLLFNTVDKVLSQINYDWYTQKNYINYVIGDTDKIYFQCKADIKVNLFIIFSVFFQTIKIKRRKNGNN